MNICKPHSERECKVCWPGGWTLGYEAAVNRLETQVAVEVAYNVLAQDTCDHKGLWKNYPENICGPRPYEVLDVPHGIRCKRCGSEIPEAEVLAALTSAPDEQNSAKP